MQSSTIFLALLSIYASVSALPTPVAEPTPIITNEPRGVLSNILGNVETDLALAVSAVEPSSVLSDLLLQSATATPTAVSQAFATLSSIYAAKPSNIFDYNAALIANGLVSDSVEEVIAGVASEFSPEDSSTNINLRRPSSTIYPKKSSSDAPYSVSQAELQAAIYIPSTFTYGKKPPVILFPGTGSTGYTTFIGNYIPLLTGVSWADPVWVNVPGLLFNDAQVNAEYAAYAINYIAGITKKDVAVIAWSQGNIDAQWAYKYWSSTRKVVTDHIAFSADYEGTILADFISPTGFPDDPSVLQQRYGTTSNFITTLRNDGGDSAYVPTTSIYSSLGDEIVEPQQGTGASAYLLDARNVGVTNNEFQTICPGQVAGSLYTHEGALYNPIGFALVKDALTHSGPGQVSRIDTTALCGQYLATGLDLGDLLLTENSILVAGVALVLHQPKVTEEPAIMSYAA